MTINRPDTPVHQGHIKNWLILSESTEAVQRPFMNLKSVADQFREIDRGEERNAQVNTTFIYEDKRSSVLVDKREGQTLHVVYEPQCSLTSASMMGGVILLIPSHTQGEPLSVDQRLMLSCTHRAGATLVVCFEEQRFSTLKALLTNVSLNREQRELYDQLRSWGGQTSSS